MHPKFRMPRNLRRGTELLTLWLSFNLLLALAIVVAIVVGKNAPAVHILMDAEGVSRLDAKALATINAMGVLLNAAVVSMCVLALSYLWRLVRTGVTWAYWTLAASLGFLQICGFLSDQFFEAKNMPMNLISLVILVSGLVLARPKR